MTDNTLMNCKESKSELDQVGGWELDQVFNSLSSSV